MIAQGGMERFWAPKGPEIEIDRLLRLEEFRRVGGRDRSEGRVRETPDGMGKGIEPMWEREMGDVCKCRGAKVVHAAADEEGTRYVAVVVALHAVRRKELLARDVISKDRFPRKLVLA